MIEPKTTYQNQTVIITLSRSEALAAVVELIKILANDASPKIVLRIENVGELIHGNAEPTGVTG